AGNGAEIGRNLIAPNNERLGESVAKPSVTRLQIVDRPNDPGSGFWIAVIGARRLLQLFAGHYRLLARQHRRTRDEQTWITLDAYELGNIRVTVPVMAASDAGTIAARPEAFAEDANRVGQPANIRRACLAVHRHKQPPQSQRVSADPTDLSVAGI